MQTIIDKLMSERLEIVARIKAAPIGSTQLEFSKLALEWNGLKLEFVRAVQRGVNAKRLHRP